MRLILLIPLILLVSACSDATSQSAAKAPEKPAEPVTGRQAFQSTYPSARMWAADCQPIQIRSLLLDEMKSDGGKVGAWEITYASAEKGGMRPFTWSAIEADPNIHKGVFGGGQDAWTPGRGTQTPFLPAALKIDTPEALETATAKATTYLAKPGTKPPVGYMLEMTNRAPDPVWRVYWGANPTSAEFTVFVDATTGAVLNVVR